MILNKFQKYLLDACRINFYHPPIFKQLLSQAPDINFTDKEGKTCLYWATTNNNVELIQLLVMAGADLQKKDCKGLTPLHAAVLVNAYTAIVYLIKLGANTDAQDDALWTPLHWAVHLGYKETALALLSAGASIKARDKNNVSPYQIATLTNQAWADELYKHYEHVKSYAKRALIHIHDFKQQIIEYQQLIMQQQIMLIDMNEVVKKQVQQLSTQIEQLKQAQQLNIYNPAHIARTESPSAFIYSGIRKA